MKTEKPDNKPNKQTTKPHNSNNQPRHEGHLRTDRGFDDGIKKSYYPWPMTFANLHPVEIQAIMSARKLNERKQLDLEESLAGFKKENTTWDHQLEHGLKG